jgi:multidrug efflux pump subunit AcrA (membrane-fusion protein)
MVVLGTAAVLGTLAASWGLASMRAAAPSVARASVWIDRVRSGELLREVGGPGTLVPEEIRWVVAREAARVERIHVRPGVTVVPETVLIELSNPDLEIQALEASRELGSAEAELADRRGALEMEALAQESRIAQLATEQREAERQARAAEELSKQNLIAALELTRRREVAVELGSRVALERKRASVLDDSSDARLRAAQEKIERLRALSDYRAKQVADLRVAAGLAGTLQELSLEVGQQVSRGQLLAKVARADALKAELRIPEAQAREVRAGQPATVDTRNGVVRGHVVRVDPVVQQGSVTVEVVLDEALPEGARPEQSVDGRIQLERLGNVRIVGRPAAARPGATLQIFVLDESGRYADRRAVKLGGSSVSEIEVVEGLAEGDRVILSDMSEWDTVDRVELD